MKQGWRLSTALAGAVGLAGSLACVGAMVLVTLGAVGAGVSAGMAGMGAQGAPAGPLSNAVDLFLQAGPTILLVSVGLITVSLASRRRISALPALAGGGIMYWGMYGQANSAIMDAVIVLGLLIWLGAGIWTRHTVRRGAQPSIG